MSTLGKVLAGLVLVMILVWIVLIAVNAEKNWNWQTAINKLQKQVVQLETEVQAEEDSIVKTRDAITQVQFALGQELAVGRAKRAAAEEARSAALADLLRLKNLQATSEATQKSAEADRDLRVSELNAETEDLAKKRDEVAKLQAVNKEQMDRLDALRKDFVRLQAANRAKVAQLRK